MINIVVFSKDRACQLDLCLRTLFDNFPKELMSKPVVQYTYSNEEFKKGYDKIASDHPVIMRKESNFELEFKGIVSSFTDEFILCLTDDDVFINKIDIKELTELLNLYRSDNRIHSFSLRMNPKINYCFPAKTPISPPKLDIKDYHFTWNWGEALNQHYCWGYPMAIDNHIYRLDWFKNKIRDLHFHNANSLESCLNRSRDFAKPIMLSFKETKIFNIQNNFVQGKRNGETHFNGSIEVLNSEYLNGKKINEKIYYGMKPTQAHNSMEYKLV